MLLPARLAGHVTSALASIPQLMPPNARSILDAAMETSTVWNNFRPGYLEHADRERSGFIARFVKWPGSDRLRRFLPLRARRHDRNNPLETCHGIGYRFFARRRWRHCGGRQQGWLSLCREHSRWPIA